MAADQLEQRYSVSIAPSMAAWRPTWNAAPTHQLPVILGGSRGRRMGLMHWGWRRDFSKALLINARGEELKQKKTFQPALNARRCLVPASGFYEWREADRQPFYFRRSDGDAVAIGGLWDPAQDLPAFLLLTVEANQVVAPVHHRMAWLVQEGDWDRWLDERVPYGAVESLVRAGPPEDVEAVAISDAVSRVANDGPELIEARS